jgi:hypothetical protein
MRRLACIAFGLAGIVGAGCSHPSAPPSSNAALDAGVTITTTAWAHCGHLDCRQYDSVAAAFESALTGGPRVIAIGEAHAQKGTTVPSSAHHFTYEILPLLVGRASDLLVEAMNPPKGCGKTTEAVRGQQAVVTEKQAPADQGEYVAMGARARELGIVPDLLRPSCEDLAAVEASGEDAVQTSLAMIARLTRTQVGKMLARDESTPGDQNKLVVTYGGALHNDPTPSPERAEWSFGPALIERTAGRYVAIDLYVPELIDGSDAWKRLAFYPYYDPAKDGAKATVFRDGKSFVIVLPRTAAK